LKGALCWLTLRNCITTHGTKKHKFSFLYTGLFKMMVGALTTCYTQYTWDSSIQLHQWIKKFSKFSFMMCGVH